MRMNLFSMFCMIKLKEVYIMAKNPAQEKITHNFYSDGSPYDQCRKCAHYTRENGRETCKKIGKFCPTIAFSCYKFNPDYKGDM